jgi:hypothetical protein
MLYTKKDVNFLQKQADNKDLGPTVREYYKTCITEIESNGKVDTADVRKDEHGNSTDD